MNPYDPCVANKLVNGKQLKVTWHVDDLKASHVQEEVIDNFIKWLEAKYGDDEYKVKVVKGKKHDYLGMIIDYTQPGKVKIDVTYYVKKMLDDFPVELKENVQTPASESYLMWTKIVRI